MRIKQFKELLKVSIPARKKILAVSQPGIGKTETVLAVASELKMPCVLMHPAISDPTDFKGMPALSKNGKEALFVPFGDLVTLIEAKEPLICFIDDIGQSPMGVQAPLMQLLHGRRLNGVEISENVIFIGATNDVNQNSGVSGLIEPLKSRWDSILRIDYNPDDFCQWLLDKNFPPECVAFVRSFPGEICPPFKATKDMTNSPCPRTVAAMFRWYADGVNDLEVFEGSCGKGLSAQFVAFLQLMDKLPSLDAILLNPDKVEVPTEASMRYAVACGLSHRADEHNFERALRYIKRITEKKYEVLFCRDALSKNKKIAECRAFLDWATKNANVMI